MKPLVLAASLFAVVLAGGAYVNLRAQESSCYARWSDSGYEAFWTAGAGCRVFVVDRWVPERAVVKLLPAPIPTEAALAALRRRLHDEQQR